MLMNEGILLVLLGLFVLCAYVFHKVRRVHLMQYDLKNEIENSIPKMLNSTYNQIQAFIVLDRLLELPKALPPLRGWAASPDFLLVITEFALQNIPEVIVECSSGASTIVLAQCAKHNGEGHVYSLEHDPIFAEKTRNELKKQALNQWATVIDAPLKNYELEGQNYQWYSLDEPMINKKIDMIVVDGPPAFVNQCARYPAGPLLLPLLKMNGVVFLDDANRSDEQIIINKWLTEFPELKKQSFTCEKGAVALFNLS